MRRKKVWWISLALLMVLTIAGAVSSRVPLLACPSCSGAGTITVMASHPEAMGSAMSPSGRLMEIGCPACDGTARVTLCRRFMGEPPALWSR